MSEKKHLTLGDKWELNPGIYPISKEETAEVVKKYNIKPIDIELP